MRLQTVEDPARSVPAGHAIVGTAEGTGDGKRVGAGVGCTVGVADGLRDVNNVGLTVGALLGTGVACVGAGDGAMNTGTALSFTPQRASLPTLLNIQ